MREAAGGIHDNTGLVYIGAMRSTESVHSAIETLACGNGLPADGALVRICAPERVKAAIGSMERTEEATFSPDGRLLAIAGFGLNRINLYAIDVTGKGRTRTVAIPACVTLHSNVLQGPHGIAFIDQEHMAVANRDGGAYVFRIPPDPFEHDEVHLRPIRKLRSGIGAKVSSPGSLACYELGDDRFRILVCNNYIHTITSHTGTLPQKTRGLSRIFNRIRNDGIFLEKGLSVPDGICASPDRKWLAVSVHTSGNLHLYQLDQPLDRNTPPAAILEGVVCPHGLQFSADGNVLYAADSASPYLHLFYRRDHTWVSLPKPDKSIHILSEEQFSKGRYNAEEGGLKGIDVLHRENILVVTCEFHPLAFYDLEILPQLSSQDIDDEIREKSQLRDQAMAAIGWK
jgi:hypothetical protein